MYCFDVFLQTVVFHVFLSTFHTLKSGPDVLLLDVPVEGFSLIIFLATDRAHEAASVFISTQFTEHAQELDLCHFLLQIHS